MNFHKNFINLKNKKKIMEKLGFDENR